MPTPFLDAFSTRGQALRVSKVFEAAIRASLEKHPVRHLTDAEIKRRFAICEKWFRTLRGDKRWGIDRTLDAIPLALEGELSGVGYEPDGRAVWCPGDGA